MPTFIPPTVNEAPAGGGRLFTRYKLPRGITVMKSGGTYVEHRFPDVLDLVGLTEGVDYFLGGHIYTVSEAVAEALTVAGFPVTGIPGYTDLYLGAYT